jgi:RimJ/RimL family protein N-acetyltransferase
MPPQIIETERLLLRLHRIEDFDRCHAIWSDPHVVRFLGGKPFTREEAWSRLLRYIGHWTALDYGMWAVETRDTGDYVGDIGFLDAKRELDPPFGDTPEVGWVLDTQAHGKGYATEAVRAALDWGDRHFSGRRTVCLIDTANLPSIRVAEKCGFQEFHRTTYKGQPVILFDRLA